MWESVREMVSSVGECEGDGEQCGRGDGEQCGSVREMVSSVGGRW